MTEVLADVERQIRLHDRYFQVLLETVRRDHYPSATMLNMLEDAMVGPEREEFVNLLLDKVADDRFPSIPMLKRIARLVG